MLDATGSHAAIGLAGHCRKCSFGYHLRNILRQSCQSLTDAASNAVAPRIYPRVSRNVVPDSGAPHIYSYPNLNAASNPAP